MKNTKFIYSILIAIMLLLNGCGGGEDPFSVLLDVEPPEHVKQLAVHCYVADKNEVLYASLAETRALLDVRELLEDVDDGSISLYNEGTKLFDFAPFPNFNSFVNYSFNNEGEFGVKEGVMELRASAPGYPELVATQQFPNFVPVTNFEYEEDGTIDFEGNRVDAVEITFVDPSGEENFYEINLVAIDSSCAFGSVNSYEVYFETQDLNAEQGGNYNSVLLSDAGFEGLEYKIILGIWGEIDSKSSLVLNWKCISKEHYEYSKSLASFSNSQDLGGFGEPVSIFSNVENGIGIFTCGREELYTVLPGFFETNPSSITATINGVIFDPCEVEGSIDFAEDIAIEARNGEEFFFIRLGETEVGVINSDDFSVEIVITATQSSYFYSDGVLEITAHDESTNFISGTFDGTLTNPNNTSDILEVENLEFEVFYKD